MATHSSIFAWRIPWTEELDGLCIVHMGHKEQDTTEATLHARTQQKEEGWPSRDTEATQEPRVWRPRAATASWGYQSQGRESQVTLEEEHQLGSTICILLVGMSYCRVCFSERGQYQGAGVGAGSLQDGVNTQQDCCEKSRRARASDTDASYVIAFDPISSLLYLSSCSLHPSLLSANNLMDFTTFSSSLPYSLFQKVFHLRAVMGCGMKRHQTIMLAAFMCVIEAQITSEQAFFLLYCSFYKFYYFLQSARDTVHDYILRVKKLTIADKTRVLVDSPHASLPFGSSQGNQSDESSFLDLFLYITYLNINFPQKYIALFYIYLSVCEFCLFFIVTTLYQLFYNLPFY